MKDKAVKRGGKKIALIALVSLLAILILAASLFFGISSCTNKGGQIDKPAEGTTVRKAAPVDGSKPIDHTAIDNIAYMAYVLDNQPSYHAYANNSTKSTGYEQVTQTWKDYKSAELSGIGQSVMVCSDLSFSMLVKASTQTCFVGNEAYMRTGSKPTGKNTVPTEVGWSNGQPAYYTKDDYRKTYGDFSTELSVYVLNEDTVESAEDVIDNKDGTYSQKFYLNSEAAYWYQYGMKTRGSLKFYPEFEKIEITFTFDGKWQVLSSYCEEKAKIAPSALGGMPMGSNSKTTTTFEYGTESFDNANYAYFDNYYKDYLGAIDTGKQPVKEGTREMLDVLGSAFSEVVNPEGNGQQFALELTIGETQYTGKLYLKLADLGDILGSLDVRLALEKKDSGKQDLFVQFKDGAVNVYYSDGFAVVADISKISASVGKITEWINSFEGEADLETVVNALSDEQSTGLDLDSLINGLNFTWNETSACVSLASDDLLGLGIGLNLQLNVDSFKDENGWNDTFKNLTLNSITYNSNPVNLSLAIVPDNGNEIISRDEADSSADLAEYIDGVYNLLNSKTYFVNLSLDGSSAIKYINGLTVNADAQVKLSGGYKNIEVNVPVSVKYGDISAKLQAYYIINLENGNYGNVYLHLTNVCGKEVDAKVCCDIKDTVDAVTQLINFINGKTDNVDVVALAETQAEESVEEVKEVNTVANVINTVLGLDFAAIIKDLKADEDNISVSVNVDEILGALNQDLGLKFGELSLTLGLENGIASLSGVLPEHGLNLAVSGSGKDIAVPDTSKYADVTNYLNGVYNLINSKTYFVSLSLDYEIQLQATAQLKLSEDYKQIEVNVPLSVKYGDISAELEAYYTINLENKNYGSVYLHLTNVCGKEVDAKVYCDIRDAVDAVTKLIEYFNGSDKTDSTEETKKIANVTEILLNLDYGAIINKLIANDGGVKLSLNVDKILENLGIDLGIEFGTVSLELGLDESKKATLYGVLPEYGLNIGVNGSEEDLTLPDTTKYADVTSYVDGVYNLINSKTYFVSLSLDYEIQLQATAQVKLSEDYKQIEVNVPVSVKYNDLSAELEVYYTINLENGNYGNVYLHLTNVCGKEVDAKVCCDIQDTVDAVTQLINYFNGISTATLADEEVSKVTDIINLVLNLDYAAIITELKADENNISVSVDVDEILTALGIQTGVSFGGLSLELNVDVNNKVALTGAVPQFGLTVNVCGSEEDLTLPDITKYADLTAYVNGVYNLINSKTYLVNIALDGSSEIEYISGAEVYANAEVSLSEDYKDITVKIPDLSVKYNSLTVILDVYYNINLDNEDYGSVYLNLKNISGKEVEAKVYSNIKDTVGAVSGLIDYLSGISAATLADGEETEKIANVIDFVVGLDYAAIITELKADEKAINLSVNADEILGAFGFELGLKLGTVALELSVDENEKVVLSGQIPALGLNLGIIGSEEEITFDTNGYADITEYINAVYALIDGKTYLVDIALDGSCGIEYINGLEVYATAQVAVNDEFSEITVYIPELTVSYIGLTVALDVYYTINLENGDYGNVYLNLVSINGNPVGAKVCCNIKDTADAVINLIDIIGGINTASTLAFGNEEVEKIANIIELVTEINYAEIITELKANDKAINLSVDADKILEIFAAELGINFGTVALDFTIDGNDKLVLSGSVPALGLTLKLSGDYNGITVPDADEYLDLTELIGLITSATVEAQKIIENKDLSFDINATLTVDGVSMTVKGSGEVIWKEDKIRVAADLTLTIAEKDNSQSVAIKFLYDQTQDPLVRFTVNGLGLEIYQSDIDGVSKGFGEIMQAVNGLTGSANGASAASYGLVSGEEASNENAIDFAEILSTVLKAVNNVTVKLQGGADVKHLIISYAQNVKLSLSSNGDLALSLNIKNNSGTEILNIQNASVCAGNGGIFAELSTQFEEVKFYKSSDEKSFVRAVYEYVFDLLDNLTVKNLLGSNTYSVEVYLNGSESGIKALDGINVKANLYYTEVTEDEEEEAKTSKLAEAELELDIKGTAVIVNAYFVERNLYIELKQVGDTKLEEIAFKASADEIYAAAETLVKIITGEALAKLTANSGNPAPAALSLDGGKNGASTAALTDVLNYLLTLEIQSVIQFNCVAIDEIKHNTLTVNPDGLLKAFDLDIKIGLIHVEVNPVTHSVFASVANEETSWIMFNAQAVTNGEDGEHKLFVPDDKFIDIGFVETLLDDLNNALEGMTTESKDEQTEETIKETDVRLSFTGDINIGVNISNLQLSKIEIKSVNLTVGFDENNEFYLTFYGHLIGNSIAILGTVTTDTYIGVTYSNGYIVFGRDVNSDNAIYKVMTPAYLIDNLMDNIFWLIGTGSAAKGIISAATKSALSGLSSGLTKTEDFYLYDNGSEVPETPEESVFKLSDIIKGLSVKLNGEASGFGNVSDVDSNINSKFSLTDNYYAANVDVSSLIGNVLRNIYVAIVRNSECGIYGLDAYAEVDSYLKITAMLDGGLTKSHAQNYYNTVISNNNINFGYYDNYEYKIFGCYDTQSGTYYSSDINQPYNLTVYGFEEGKEYNTFEQGDKEILSRVLNSGSTVYLFENEDVQWLNDEHTRKLIYVDENGNDLGLSFVITADTVIYAMIVGQREVTFHNLDGTTYTYSLFVGEELPDPAVIDGKTFAGWYLEDGTRVSVMQIDETDYYAQYVESNTVINGVIYSFAKDSSLPEGGYYFVSGTTDVSAYNGYDSWLVLENEIENELGTYPVTQVGKSALANKGLKNILVPENISYICENAFSDNNDIRTVVFLAPVVKLEGTVADNTYPFYGCTVGSNGGNNDGRTTNLNVYYKTIVTVSGEEYADDDTAGIFCWQHVRTFTEWFSTKYRYIQNNPASAGSHIYSEGQWAYVDYALGGDKGGYTLSDLGLANFVTTSAEYDRAAVENAVKQALNAITAQHGYINAYNVEIVGEYKLNGRVVLTVTLKLLPETEWWYSISADGIYGEEQTAVTILGEITTFNGMYFIKAGTTVELLPYNGLMFVECDYSEAVLTEENYVFTMPVGALEINVVYQKKPISEVKLTSFIQSTYGEASTDGYIVTLETDGETVLETPVASGYVFVGWAYDVLGDGNLAFTQSIITAQNAVPEYYAIWAVAREEILSVSTLTDGANPNAASVAVDTDKAKGFYKWYSESTFENEVNAITTSTTVLYARLQYNFEIIFAGNSDSTFSVSGKINNSATVATYTLEFDVIEGESVSIELVKQSGSYVFKSYNWNNCVITYQGNSSTVSAYKKNNNNNANRRTFTINSITRDAETQSVNVTTGQSVTIDNIRSNISINASY